MPKRSGSPNVLGLCARSAAWPATLCNGLLRARHGSRPPRCGIVSRHRVYNSRHGVKQAIVAPAVPAPPRLVVQRSGDRGDAATTSTRLLRAGGECGRFLLKAQVPVFVCVQYSDSIQINIIIVKRSR